MSKYFFISILALSLFSCSEEEVASNHVDTPNYYVPGQNIKTLKTGYLEGQKETLDLSIGEMQLNPVQYVKWINSQDINSLTKTKEISEVNFELKHLPAEYMISNDLKKQNISQFELDSLLSEYSGMEYYQLNISIDDFYEETAKYGVADMAEYQQRIAYMSFNMQNDLSVLVDGNKEIPCQLFHFERTYGIAPYATFLFGFSKEQMGDQITERTVVLNDNIFNKGLIKFHWQTAEIENVPKIQVI